MEHVFHKPLAFRNEEDIRKDLRDTIYSITQSDQSQHFQLPDAQTRVPVFQRPDTQAQVPVFQLPDTQTQQQTRVPVFQLPDTQAQVPVFQLPDTQTQQQTRVPVFQLPDTQTEQFQAQESFDINHNYAKITFVILIIVVIVLIYFNIKLYIKQTRLEAIVNSMLLQNIPKVL